MTRLKFHPPQIASFAALANYLSARAGRAFRADWRADAFGHEYMLRARDWRAGERVLDAGCGFSYLPRLLHKRFGVEAWGADDFGRGPMPYWARAQDLDAFLSANADVRYVFELLGDPVTSTLPKRYFDVVYSKYGVHFSPPPHAPIWRHMESILSEKPGSEIIILIPHTHVTNGEAATALDRMNDISAVEKDVERRLRRGERLDEPYWDDLQTRISLRESSPFLYCAYICSIFSITDTIPDEALKVENFCLDPRHLIDPPYKGFLDAFFSRRASEVLEFDPGRYTPVAYRLERTA